MHPVDLAPFGVRFLAGAGAGLLTWIAAVLFGTAIVRRLVPQAAAPLAAGVGSALGYGAVGSAVALLGLAHAIGTWQCVAVLLALACVGAVMHWVGPTFVGPTIGCATSSTGATTTTGKPTGATGATTTWILAACFAAAVITMCVLAALPTVWWDPLAYHLPLVAGALADGYLRFDPSLTQSGFPQLAEAATVPAYALAGTAGAQFAALGCALVLALLVGAIAEAYERGTPALAATLVVSSALVMWLGPTAYVDVAFAMFVVGALALPLSWRGFNGLGAPLVAGMLAGCAAAVKYPGAVDVLVVCAAVAIAWRSWLSPAIALGGAALVAGGWYVRNALQTGDPAYPFLTAAGIVAPSLHVFAARYVSMTQNWCGGPPSLVGAMSLPVDLVLNPLRYCGDPGYALRFGVAIALIAWLLRRDLAPPYQILGALVALWYASSRQLRFFVPALALVAFVAALGAVRTGDRLRPLVVGVLATLCALGVIVQWLPQTEKTASASIVPAFAYITGAESADSYLSRRLEFYDAERWLRQRVPGVPAASLDEVRLYYAGAATRDANPFYQPVTRVDWHGPPEKRFATLIAAGDRYVLVNANDAYVRRTPTGVDWSALADSIKRGRLKQTFAANGVTVYELMR